MRYAFSRPLKSGWNPAPISRSAVTRPFTSSVPDVGFAVPARSLRSVDFPDPFAPTTPNDSPGATAKLTSCNAWTCSAGAYCRSTVSFKVRVRSRRSL